MKKANAPKATQVEVLEALAEAGKQYREYVELARLAAASSQQKTELLSYQRTWSHPLGLAIQK